MVDSNKYTVMWVTRLNHAQDKLARKLKGHLYNIEEIASDKNYALLKYAVMYLLFDHIHEIDAGYEFPKEQVEILIARHKKQLDFLYDKLEEFEAEEAVEEQQSKERVIVNTKIE